MDDVFGRAIRDLRQVLAEAGDADRLRIERIIARLELGSDGLSLGETSVRITLDTLPINKGAFSDLGKALPASHRDVDAGLAR